MKKADAPTNPSAKTMQTIPSTITAFLRARPISPILNPNDKRLSAEYRSVEPLIAREML
jgi:hypothetical protein